MADNARPDLFTHKGRRFFEDADWDQEARRRSGTGTGSEWFVDSGVPAGGIHNIGDFYIDSDDYKVYKKTGAATWTYQGIIIKGADGAAGANGSKLFNGSGDPSSGLGSIGDYYINQDSPNYFYEKVGSTVWLALFPLQGVQGNPGIGVMIIQMIYHGSSEISGVTVPDNSWIQINTI